MPSPKATGDERAAERSRTQSPCVAVAVERDGQVPAPSRGRRPRPREHAGRGLADRRRATPPSCAARRRRRRRAGRSPAPCRRGRGSPWRSTTPVTRCREPSGACARGRRAPVTPPRRRHAPRGTTRSPSSTPSSRSSRQVTAASPEMAAERQYTSGCVAGRARRRTRGRRCVRCPARAPRVDREKWPKSLCTARRAASKVYSQVVVRVFATAHEAEPLGAVVDARRVVTERKRVAARVRRGDGRRGRSRRISPRGKPDTGEESRRAGRAPSRRRAASRPRWRQPADACRGSHGGPLPAWVRRPGWPRLR